MGGAPSHCHYGARVRAGRGLFVWAGWVWEAVGVWWWLVRGGGSGGVGLFFYF